MITLHEHQKLAIKRFEQDRRRRVIIQECTGLGKTEIAIEIMKNYIEKGSRCLFFTHTKELRDQSFKRIAKSGIDAGNIASGVKFESGKPCYVSMVQTMSSRIGNNKEICSDDYFNFNDFDFTGIDIVIFDECHHIDSPQWCGVMDILDEKLPNARFLGLSATPIGSNGKGLSKYFDSLIQGMQRYEAIDKGLLCDFEYYSGGIEINYEELGIEFKENEKSDFTPKDVRKIESEFDRMKLYGDVVKEWEEKALRKKTLAFCLNIAHANKTRDEFKSCGYNFEVIHSEMKKSEREQIVNDYITGKLCGLVNVGIFTEGNDVPSIECVLLVAGTRSLRKYTQQIGRGLRIKPDGGKLIIIDFAKNWALHGLPNEALHWSLTDAVSRPDRKNKKSGALIEWMCGCFAINHKNKYKCWKCGELNLDKIPFETQADLYMIQKERETKQAKHEAECIIVVEKYEKIQEKYRENFKKGTSDYSENHYEQVKDLLIEYLYSVIKERYPDVFNDVCIFKNPAVEWFFRAVKFMYYGEVEKAHKLVDIMVDFEVENFIDDNINKRSQSFSRIMYNKNHTFSK